MVAASIKANDKKILLDALFKLAQHEDSFKELILATAAKLRLVKNISEMTKGMPKELRVSALVHNLTYESASYISGADYYSTD